MPARDPLDAVLLDLRLAPFSTSVQVAARTGLAPGVVEDGLAALTERRLVRHRTAVPAGWMLSPAGREGAARGARAELDAAGARPAVDAAYRHFLTLNQPFLQACTDWQLIDVGSGVPNDHADAGYDAAVLARLDALHHDLQPVLEALSGALGRFARYAPRFAHAWAQVSAGDTDWIFSTTRDSFHTIWFALHEDLLVTLDIERGAGS